MSRTISALATERRHHVREVWDNVVARDEIAVQVIPSARQTHIQQGFWGEEKDDFPARTCFSAWTFFDFRPVTIRTGHVDIGARGPRGFSNDKGDEKGGEALWGCGRPAPGQSEEGE